MNLSLQDGLILYLILLGSLSVHEWAHAWTADKLGDPTARSLGRVTLNPIAHIDPIGTVFLPLLMILMPVPFAIFGWGKPVPVDRRNLSKPVRDDVLIAMAGPLSNLLILIFAAVLVGLYLRITGADSIAMPLQFVFMINLVLMIFNLLPIPPLDGSHVFRHAVGMTDMTYFKLAQWGFVILIVLINFPPFRALLGGAIQGGFGLVLALVGMVAGAG